MVSLPGIPGGSARPAAEKFFTTLGSSPRPILVDYAFDAGGETFRTELSGRVLTNWATKMTHLLDASGVYESSSLAIDLPVSWLSTGLVLGAAWSGAELNFVSDEPDGVLEAEFLLTDRVTDWDEFFGEILAVGLENDDPTVINVDAEISAQADQPLLPDTTVAALVEVAGVGNEGNESVPASIAHYSHGLAVATGSLRFNATVLVELLESFGKLQPAVLIHTESDDAAWTQAEAVAKIIADERIDY